jgi:hypothetical protein
MYGCRMLFSELKYTKTCYFHMNQMLNFNIVIICNQECQLQI